MRIHVTSQVETVPETNSKRRMPGKWGCGQRNGDDRKGSAVTNNAKKLIWGTSGGFTWAVFMSVCPWKLQRLWRRKRVKAMRNTVTVKVLRALLTNDYMGVRCHRDPSDGWVDGCSGSFIATWSTEKVVFHQESQHWLPPSVSQWSWPLWLWQQADRHSITLSWERDS